MTWWVALTGGMVLLLSLFLLGVPIFVAFVVLNVIGVFAFFGAPVQHCAGIKPHIRIRHRQGDWKDRERLV